VHQLRAIPVLIAAYALVGGTTVLSAATACEQRASARRLRDDRSSSGALVVLDDVELAAESAADSVAVRLDRAELLLDLWRVSEATAEIERATRDLQAAPVEEGSCGDDASESSIRALELSARASRVAGKYGDAARAWTRALSQRRSEQPANAAAFVRSLVLASDTFDLAGDDTESGRLGDEALALAQSIEPPDEALLARALEGAGMQASSHGAFDRAEALYQQAVALYRHARGEGHPIQAGVWLSIGSMAVDRGDLLTADAAYQQVAAILEPLTDPSLASDKATLALNLGSMDARLGRVDDAREKLETARRLWTETRGPDHPHLAWVNESLSELLAEAGRLDEADVALEQAVRQRERSMPGSPIAVLTAAGLATLRARAGKAAEARTLWRSVGADAARLAGAGPLFQASVRVRRAETAEALGDVVTAARLRAEVEALLERQLPSGHPALAEARGQRARLAWLQGERREALRLATSAWYVQQRVLGETIAMLPEGDALRYVERSRDLRDLLLCTAAGMPVGAAPSAADDVMRELAASRAIISGALYARGHQASLTSAPTAERDDSDALARARRRYASLLWQPFSSASVDYVDALAVARQELEAIERKHARQSPGTAPRWATETDPWSALGARDVLVAFGRYRCPANATRRADPAGASGYVAFVRPGGRPARMVRFPDGRALERTIGDWYDAITGAIHAPPTDAQDDEIDALGREVARQLWVPLAAAIGSAERVFIVPDGALHSVNWYALPGAAGTYLIDEPRLLHVLTAESDLGAPLVAVARTDERSVVVLADPLIGSESTALAEATLGADARVLRSVCRFFDPRTLPPLDEAAAEALDVRDLARATGRSVQLATGRAASESWLRDHAPRASILHLAAHGGFLSPESCREPTGASAERAAARVHSLWAEAVRTRPLMRSGLLLTGAAGFTPLDAPGSEDDGVLVAEEASRLDLRGTDWVVLSACSTRRGPVVDAEGALGLHRAFHSAGARTVIASLWDVQDAPARRFMSALYDARLRGKRSTAEAMRDAQRAVLSELRAGGRSTHPVQWAAFVASGDWR
jgi:CHAT domain-containing protein/tetratricopeptide (TPR) repeat protein